MGHCQLRGAHALGRTPIQHAQAEAPTPCLAPIDPPHAHRRLVDAPTASGYTPLHYACIARAGGDAAAALLAHGCQVDATTWTEGLEWFAYPPRTTPFHICAARGDLDIAVAILKHYVSPLGGGKGGEGAKDVMWVRG